MCEKPPDRDRRERRVAAAHLIAAFRLRAAPAGLAGTFTPP
jgi:hypothetical protein